LLLILFFIGCSVKGDRPRPSPSLSKNILDMTAEILSVGRNLIEKEDFESAEKVLKKGLSLAPGSAELHYELGRVYSETDRNIKAKDEIEKALDIKPDYAQAYSTLGYVYLHRKEFDSAKRSFEKALSLDPKLVDSLIGLSSLYYAVRNYDRAVEILEEARNINPDEPYIYINLGLVRLRQGKPDVVEDLFKKAVKVSGSHGTAMLELADFYVHIKDYDRAEEIYREIIDLEPGNPHTVYEAHQGLGEVAYMTGRLYLAENENLIAFEINKNDPTAVYLLSAIYRKTGRKNKAGEFINRALEIDPNDLYVLCETGRYYLDRNDHAKAKRYFNRVLELSAISDDEKLRSAYEGGEVPRYACTYSMAEVEVPQSMALCGIGKILIGEGKLYDAYPLLDRALSLYKYNGDAYFVRGLGKLREKDYKEAEKQFKKALEVDPYHVDSLKRLLKIVENRDGRESAEKLVRKYLQKARYLENDPEIREYLK